MNTAQKTLLAFVAVALPLGVPFVSCSIAAGDERDNQMQGKVFCGYQGWFGAQGDSTEIGFDNYQFAGVFEPGMCVIDYWPDLAEFDEEEKYETEFRHADGSVAHVFSAANAKTVDRHFNWIKEYGIDGIFLQRFGWALKQPANLRHRNQVLKNVRISAAQHERLWALMYDLTSLEAGDIAKYVIPDFKKQARERRLANDPTYVQLNGKPVVAIWGVGFNDQRAYTLEECRQLVEFLKNDSEFGGHAVMLGVPYYWREQRQDTVTDPLLHEILKQADVISPWSVGRYQNIEQARERLNSTLPADAEWAKKNQLAYLPVLFPGFSWHNLAVAEGRNDPLDQIPREGGRFLWSQAKAVADAGLDMVYVAMFDEMNEGTCIFKCTDDPPVGKSPFLTYAVDQLPSDHYLWLTGQIGRLMSGDITASPDPPQRKLEQAANE